MKKILLALVCWVSMSAALAFVPEGGFWAVDSELNGQPGRGFQIDIQGSALVLSFYGYLPDGRAQWYLASGSLSNNRFSAALYQYEGGMALGGAPVAAHETNNAGTVTIAFTNAMQGTITLPGEATKAISRLNFARPSNPLSLVGEYQLERTFVMYSTGSTLDSLENATVTGSMYVNNSGSMRQSMRVTYNGKTTNVVAEGTYTDYTTHARFVSSAGTSNVRIAMRGDRFITVFHSSSLTELDYWRRVSADGTIKTAQTTRSFGDTETVVGGLVGVLVQE